MQRLILHIFTYPRLAPETISRFFPLLFPSPFLPFFRSCLLSPLNPRYFKYIVDKVETHSSEVEVVEKEEEGNTNEATKLGQHDTDAAFLPTVAL